MTSQISISILQTVGPITTYLAAKTSKGEGVCFSNFSKILLLNPLVTAGYGQPGLNRNKDQARFRLNLCELGKSKCSEGQ